MGPNTLCSQPFQGSDQLCSFHILSLNTGNVGTPCWRGGIRVRNNSVSTFYGKIWFLFIYFFKFNVWRQAVSCREHRTGQDKIRNYWCWEGFIGVIITWGKQIFILLFLKNQSWSLTEGAKSIQTESVVSLINSARRRWAWWYLWCRGTGAQVWS